MLATNPIVLLEKSNLFKISVLHDIVGMPTFLVSIIFLLAIWLIF